MKRLRCFIRGKFARLRGVVWNGHCWGDGGVCIDCGKR